MSSLQLKIHSSGAVWESRWTSWTVRPNEPSGFRGRKELLNFINPPRPHSSGAVWESRWPSWAVRPNEPSGFLGRKAILNHASALVSACPLYVNRHPRTLSNTTYLRTAASSFSQGPCSSRSRVSNSSSCCLCIWFRGEPVSSYFSMACCSVVSHWCKWCMFIMLSCYNVPWFWFLNTWVISALLPRPGCSRHGVIVHCMCVQILSFCATRWPVLPECMQLTLVSWYVLVCYSAIVRYSFGVMLCRCKRLTLSRVWFLCAIS